MFFTETSSVWMSFSAKSVFPCETLMCMSAQNQNGSRWNVNQANLKTTIEERLRYFVFLSHLLAWNSVLFVVFDKSSRWCNTVFRLNWLLLWKQQKMLQEVPYQIWTWKTRVPSHHFKRFVVSVKYNNILPFLWRSLEVSVDL